MSVCGVGIRVQALGMGFEVEDLLANCLDYQRMQNNGLVPPFGVQVS